MSDFEKELSGEESLRLINKMIYEAKGYYYESGISGLIYGFAVIICALLTYAKDKTWIALSFSPFYLLLPIFFLQAWIQWRENKKKAARTYTDETIDYIWLGFFLSAIAAAAGSFAGFPYMVITIIIFLAAFATFLTGMIAKFTYHKVSGIVCLLLAVLSFFMQNENVYLLLAITAVLIWVIPGFILNITFKKLHHAR